MNEKKKKKKSRQFSRSLYRVKDVKVGEKTTRKMLGIFALDLECILNFEMICWVQNLKKTLKKEYLWHLNI